MASAEEAITDASDWLSTPVPGLEQLDHALRCQVCKEFFESPMITSCAHTFCSLCIRRCLSADGKCPFCRASDQPTQLRKNTAVEEAVKTFLAARPGVLQLAQGAAAHRSERKGQAREGRKRKVRQAGLGDRGGPSPRKTRAGGRTAAAAAAAADQPVWVEDSEAAQTSSEEEREPTPPNDGLVACPICGKRMPEERVFGHLESHDDSKQSNGPTPPFAIGQSTSLATRQINQEPLPGLNYSMLTEPALRKRIQTLGIPASGNKASLQRRHAEWVNIWNANCDSTRPRTRRELLRDLDTWEKSQNLPQQAPAAGSVMDKAFDGQAWASSHGAEFDDLIARARQNVKQKQAAPSAEEGAAAEASLSNETASSGNESRPRLSGPSMMPASLDTDFRDSLHSPPRANGI